MVPEDHTVSNGLTYTLGGSDWLVNLAANTGSGFGMNRAGPCNVALATRPASGHTLQRFGVLPRDASRPERRVRIRLAHLG